MKKILVLGKTIFRYFLVEKSIREKKRERERERETERDLHPNVTIISPESLTNEYEEEQDKGLKERRKQREKQKKEGGEQRRLTFCGCCAALRFCSRKKERKR